MLYDSIIHSALFVLFCFFVFLFLSYINKCVFLKILVSLGNLKMKRLNGIRNLNMFVHSGCLWLSILWEFWVSITRDIDIDNLVEIFRYVYSDDKLQFGMYFSSSFHHKMIKCSKFLTKYAKCLENSVELNFYSFDGLDYFMTIMINIRFITNLRFHLSSRARH